MAIGPAKRARKRMRLSLVHQEGGAQGLSKGALSCGGGATEKVVFIKKE